MVAKEGLRDIVLCLHVGLSSHLLCFSSSPLCYAVGTCAVPTLSTLANFCHQGLWATAHRALVGY